MKVAEKPSEIGFYSGLVVCTCPVVSFSNQFGNVLGFGLCLCANVFHIPLGQFVSPLSFSSIGGISVELCDRSDRIGRRPVIFIGLTGSMISITLFGLSKSLVWALLARGIGETNKVH